MFNLNILIECSGKTKNEAQTLFSLRLFRQGKGVFSFGASLYSL